MKHARRRSLRQVIGYNSELYSWHHYRRKENRLDNKIHGLKCNRWHQLLASIQYPVSSTLKSGPVYWSIALHHRINPRSIFYLKLASPGKWIKIVVEKAVITDCAPLLFIKHFNSSDHAATTAVYRNQAYRYGVSCVIQLLKLSLRRENCNFLVGLLLLKLPTLWTLCMESRSVYRSDIKS